MYKPFIFPQTNLSRLYDAFRVITNCLSNIPVVLKKLAGLIYFAPVGENFAVVVNLDLKHLISIQPAGNGPSKHLKQR